YHKNDIDGMLKYVHPNVIATYQNGECKRGHQGVKEFYERMRNGDNRVVEKVDTKLEVDDLAVLHGSDTAIAFGTLDDHFLLRDGMEFDLHSRWSATLVKEDGRWLIASYHASANVFDNGVLNLVLRKSSLYVGGIAGVVGLLFGIGVCLGVGRLRKQQA